MSRRVAREGLAFLLAVACAVAMAALAILWGPEESEPAGTSPAMEEGR